MEERVAEILSTAILVVLLAGGVSLGAGSIIRSNKTLTNYSSTYEDKTAAFKYTPSLKVYGSYNGKLTQGEAIIATAIQDANMPYNQKMQVGTHTISISSSYEENALTTYAGYTSSFVVPDNADTSYLFQYDYKTNNYILIKQ